MRYFTPRFQIATLVGEQRNLISKIGGVPWGLPEDFWPSCCDRPMKLLAQLCHEPPILDLGAPGAVLHLFQCLDCLGIGPEEVGGTAFIINQSHLERGLVRVAGHDEEGELGNRLIGEFWITGWDEHDDGIPAERMPEFFIEKDLWKLQDEYPHIEWFDPREKTKFGGTPRWTGNGPMGFPRSPFEFLLQIDNLLFLSGPPPNANEAGCSITEYSDDQSTESVHTKPEPGAERINAPWGIMRERTADDFYAEFTNLGTDGTLYVFIDRTQQPHRVKWIWNR